MKNEEMRNAKLKNEEMRNSKIHIIKRDIELEEMQKLVGGLIEIATLENGDTLVFDEEGKLKEKPINEEATKLYRKNFTTDDFIVGDVIILKKGYFK
jgi:hypothetical protein|tara:strand:+ start:3338 stop:3628 length:291 start_codon:yes stop_codon:yes gene_type:complete